MSVVVVRGGFNGEGDCVVSAEVKGAEWGTAEYSAHYSFTESASFRSGYAYVVAEAGLAGFAPEWDSLPFARSIIRNFQIEVEVA